MKKKSEILKGKEIKRKGRVKKREDIKINLDKDGLTISVDVPDHKYHQELKLPCEPKGKLEKFYRNGILEVRINKQDN